MPRSLLHLLMIALALAGHGAIATADPGTLLTIEGRRPDRAVVTWDDAPPPEVIPPTAMQAALAGVVADMSGRPFSDLFACFPLNPPVTVIPEDAQRWWVLHLARRDRAKRLEILRTPDSRFYARELDLELEQPRAAELDRVRFAELSADWPDYRGGFDLPVAPDHEAFELKPPLLASPILLDDDALKQRMYRRSRARVEGTARDLAASHLYARLPRRYDPRQPAGLLVWVSPVPAGIPPRVFDEALDEFNIIVVGADDSGNDRPSVDRFQLALDAVATCTSRYHVDPERIYITGLSGGGRIASMMWGCFPDVFDGAVAIVGLNSYKSAPAGGARHWPADYEKPSPTFMRLLREHRLAAITGEQDFNYENTLSKARGIEHDGFSVLVFEYEDMGHTLPTEARFTEALGWVDEPARRRRAEESARAARLLEECSERRGDALADNPGHRKELAAVIEAGPWSDAAWEAVARLNRTGDDDASEP
ncbi:MAG: prolyl oligopeptidase family serine peptidase [Phycisphaerales bacterium]|nr:prolyl oligopeptidase family serine peptidase [Phycisphaerales bacterium]